MGSNIELDISAIESVADSPASRPTRMYFSPYWWEEAETAWFWMFYDRVREHGGNQSLPFLMQEFGRWFTGTYYTHSDGEMDGAARELVRRGCLRASSQYAFPHEASQGMILWKIVTVLILLFAVYDILWR